jgi:hypothetical protein
MRHGVVGSTTVIGIGIGEGVIQAAKRPALGITFRLGKLNAGGCRWVSLVVGSSSRYSGMQASSG